MKVTQAWLLAALVGCASTGSAKKDADKKPPLPPYEFPTPPADPAPRAGEQAVLIRGARIMTAAGQIHEEGHVLMQGGVITSVGPGVGKAPDGARVVNGRGKVVTPGLIDTHSHLGVYAMPGVSPHADGNEVTNRATPEVWAEHSFWPQDPGIWRALSGGVTTMQVLPGSANLIGGRSFTAKLRPGVSAREMRFPGAPQGLKIACGENPKRVYAEKGGPMTRMGNTAHFRAAFQKAQEYRRKNQKYERDYADWKKKKAEKQDEFKDDPPDPPTRNLGLETLMLVLDGKILVHNHCYRADDLSKQLDLAAEFGFTIRSFHHGLGAYKIRHRLAKEEVAVSTWADWWGFKMEAFDGVPQNLAMLSDAGVRAIVHSDSASDIRRLNQEAAKGRAAGRKVGLDASDDEVLRWITANPAWALGVLEKTGTLEVGKMADVVLWDGNPFSVYTRAEKVFIDGELVFDRTDPESRHISDFEVGYVKPEDLP